MATKILNEKEVRALLMFLKNKVPSIRRIGLTGSYAVGLQNIKSDLDIVIDIDTNYRNEFWLIAEEVRSFLINNYMLPVDFIFYSDVKKKIQCIKPLSYCEKLEFKMYRELYDKIRWEVD